MKVIIVVALIISLIGLSQISADKSTDGIIPLVHEAFGKPKVEINLSGSLFKFISRVACEDDPELGEFLMELKDLHVRIYEQGQMSGNVAEVIRHFEKRLKKKGWEIIARIREENSDVGVYMLGDERTISGLFVMVSGKKQDFVLVNMAGNINLAQVSKLGKFAGVDFDLPQLDRSSK